VRFSHLDPSLPSYCYENFYESWNIRDGWLILKVLLISIFLLLKYSPQNDLVIFLQFAGCTARKDGENENSLFHNEMRMKKFFYLYWCDLFSWEKLGFILDLFTFVQICSKKVVAIVLELNIKVCKKPLRNFLNISFVKFWNFLRKSC